MRMIVIAGVVITSLGLGAGCGGSEEPARDYTYEDVARATNLQHDPQDSEDVFESSDGCYALVLLGRSQVDSYVDAGDTVATNPSGTVGIKTESECVDRLEQDLEELP